VTSLDRRRRHRAELRAAILDAALDIVAEQGLGALSIRAVADRVEYSAAAIYLHFESKEALLREVAREGFRRMHEAVGAAVAACGENAESAAVVRAFARAYLDFALEHTAHFRVMFDAPPVPSMKAQDQGDADPYPSPDADATAAARRRTGLLQQIAAAGPRRDGSPALKPQCAEGLKVSLTTLATIHGLVSLFLSGRLGDVATSPEELLALAEGCVAPFAAR
jgi:AcrR family transcriptional regulator